MKAKHFRSLAAASAALTVLACGGGGLGEFFNQLFFGVPHDEDVIKLILGPDVELNNGKLCLIPPGSTPTVGSNVCYIPAGSVFFKNAWKVGTPSVSIFNMNGGVGGQLAATLVQDGNDLKLDKDLAIPTGRWDLRLEGGYKFLSEEAGKSLSVGKISYEFDVFGSGFSNIPTTFAGGLPADGQSQVGLKFAGTLPPNGGQGPVFLDLKPTGFPAITYGGNKALGATDWTIESADAISTPATGFEAVTLRLQF